MKAARKKTKIDWSRLDAMTPAERHAAAMADPDARPITEEDIATGRVRPVLQVFLIRRRLRLSQEEFAAQFRIPIQVLRDWEEDRREPDAIARAYLRVISLEPAAVRRALAARPPSTSVLSRKSVYITPIATGNGAQAWGGRSR